jgi:hypothetical protein
MPDCRQCGNSLDDADNFCPRCGAPQNKQASERLQSYIRRQVEKRRSADDSGGGSTDGGTLGRRLSYVVGYAAVVAALATLPSVAGACFLLAGLSVLPPIRRAVGRAVLDRPIPPLAAAVAFVLLAGGGAVVFQFG